MITNQEAILFEQRRFNAVNFALHSESTRHAVADRFGVHPRTIGKWLKSFNDRGNKGLKAKPNKGGQSKMNSSQRRRVEKILLKGPRPYGFDTDLWTCPRIAAVVKNEIGIDYHPDRLRHILHDLGWSVQRPQRQALERNERQVSQWLHYKWPRLKKKPNA